MEEQKNTYENVTLEPDVGFDIRFVTMDHNSPFHWHREMEILYILNGHATVHMEGEEYELNPLDAVVMDYARIHEVIYALPQTMGICIHVSRQLLRRYLPEAEPFAIRCAGQRLRPGHQEYYNEICGYLKELTVLYAGCPDFDGKTYKSSYSNTGYNVRKFLVSKTISPEYNTNPNNFVVYRYADVLLKKAEALNEMGQPGQAAAPLNIVRKRAGLPEVSGLSQEAMREKIIHERRMELAFEGHRWFDMIRVNNGEYAIRFLQSIGKNSVNKNRLLFPIPQTEMDANILMTQNPGY